MNVGRNFLGRSNADGGESNVGGMASKFYASVPPTARASAVKATSTALSSAAQNEKVQNAAASNIQSSLNEQLKNKGLGANSANMISGQVGRAAPVAMSKAAQNERLMNKMSEQIVDRSSNAAFGGPLGGAKAENGGNQHQYSSNNASASNAVSVNELKQKLSALYGQNYTPTYIPDSSTAGAHSTQQQSKQPSAFTGYNSASSSAFTSSKPFSSSSFTGSSNFSATAFGDFSNTSQSNSAATRQFADPFASYNRPVDSQLDDGNQSFHQPDSFSSGTELRDSDSKLFSAIYDFQGQGDDELTFQKTDLIIVTGKVNEEWWLGRLKHALPSEKPRMFPSNFVEPAKKTRSSNAPPPVAPKPMSFSNTQQKFMAANSLQSNEPHCVALYDYVPQCAGDLAFKEGDVIKILRKVDSNWIEGEFFGSKGIFPSNFVRIEQDLPNANSGMSTTGFQPKPTKDMRKVLYTYQASSYDEISVNAGDFVEVVGTMPESKEWLSCQIGGKKGYIPANFLSP